MEAVCLHDDLSPLRSIYLLMVADHSVSTYTGGLIDVQAHSIQMNVMMTQEPRVRISVPPPTT